jgi:hypothetical protein
VITTTFGARRSNDGAGRDAPVELVVSEDDPEQPARRRAASTAAALKA